MGGIFKPKKPGLFDTTETTNSQVIGKTPEEVFAKEIAAYREARAKHDAYVHSFGSADNAAKVVTDIGHDPTYQKLRAKVDAAHAALSGYRDALDAEKKKAAGADSSDAEQDD